ncbi:M23 family metallopeptidase [Streptomyces phytohabitans]|uniref:M23 family metallopeptidase n=1 Tax=Streptomyces phytohabitans TaxID=1150371 RepID=UPI00345C208F
MHWTLVRSQRPSGERAPVRVAIPATGRWRALNGPGTKVPSHTHGHAQTYAIDLIHHPREEGPHEFRWLWPLSRRPRHYPAFGSPILSPGDGVVVATADGRRDHLSRTSLPGFAYLLAEGFVRSLGWRHHLWGNYVVIELDPGVYAAFAHLRRGSLRVAVGDRVGAGQALAECGNSGNTSEPHLHFQLMDGPDSEVARGLPFEWRYVDDERAEHTGVPKDGTYFTPPRLLDGDVSAPLW